MKFSNVKFYFILVETIFRRSMDNDAQRCVHLIYRRNYRMMEIRTNKLWHETQRNWTNENANYNVNYKTYFLSSHAIFHLQ